MSFIKIVNHHVCVAVTALLPVLSPIATDAQPAAEDKCQPIVTFLSHRTGENILYAMKPDGTQVRSVFGGAIKDIPTFTKGVTLVREPHWTRQSPNGKYFASWLYEKGIPHSKYRGDSRPMLWVGDINGKWTRIVNPDCAEEFAWSPDSTRIAFSIHARDHIRGYLQTKTESSEIWIAGIDGSNTKYVLEQPGRLVVQDWSPDGQRLLLVRRRIEVPLTEQTSELFEFRLANVLTAGNKAETTFSRGTEWTAKEAQNYLDKIKHDFGGLVVNHARYSPDGKMLAVLAHEPKQMFAPNLVADDELGRMRMQRLLGKLMTYDSSRGASQVIAAYEDGIRGPICWTHDGNEILFSRYLPKEDDREKFRADKEHGLAIWAISRDGKKARFVTTGWSPDCGRN